jgi:hypothetical protein
MYIYTYIRTYIYIRSKLIKNLDLYMIRRIDVILKEEWDFYLFKGMLYIYVLYIPLRSSKEIE